MPIPSTCKNKKENLHHRSCTLGQFPAPEAHLAPLLVGKYTPGSVFVKLCRRCIGKFWEVVPEPCLGICFEFSNPLLLFVFLFMFIYQRG